MTGTIDAWTPTATEIAIGSAFGPWATGGHLPETVDAVSPRAALEASVLEGLLRPPCGVSFSGGRDSSLVLSIATYVARREGLPPPIPLTHVFPAAPETDEDSWQELVIRHLGLSEWTRLTWHTELDVLGPWSQSVLRRVGVLDPFNAFFHDPLCHQVAGGSLLTGVGGDEVLGGVSQPAAFRIRYRHRRPRVRQLRVLARSYAPTSVRARAMRRAGLLRDVSWLRRDARAEVLAELSRWRAAEPLAWDGAVVRYWQSRECHVGVEGLRAIAAEHAVQMQHPLTSGRFLAAMVSSYGKSGPGSRARATGELGADVMPEATIRRSDKAAFNGTFWTGAASGFADTWSGAGVDEALVDVDRLRAAWRRPGGPLPSSMMLMQQAWLHDDGAGRG